MQEPPGGPPDFSAPVLLAVRPDSGAVVPGFRDAVRFQFDEIVSEQQGRLGELVLVSPRPREVDVAWKRDAIEVRPGGGWRPGIVYQVTLLPGVTDLRNNRTRQRHQVLFSTGSEIPATVLEGTVLDWENGRGGPRALIEAVLLPDSLVYVTQADSAGDFRLEALPPGSYEVIATVDGNANRRRDRREPFDSLAVTLDSAFQGVFWAFVHDTTGPMLRTATRVDSVTVRIQFSQKLAPGAPDTTAVQVRTLPDSLPLPVSAVWTVEAWDSVRAAADTTPAVDTTTPPPDTVGGRPPVGRPPRGGAGPPPADTSRIARLLAERPRLRDAWVIRIGVPLAPGNRYLISATARNVAGAEASSRTVLVLADTSATEPGTR